MNSAPLLFSPWQIRNLVLKNRFVMAPMCQYSAVDGYPQDWHYQHYETRAWGGVGLVIVEATAVSPEGRISPADLGIWEPGQAQALARLVDRVHRAGAKIAIQLAHAGRKASSQIPWKGEGGLSDDQGGWTPVAPGDVPFSGTYRPPRALSVSDIQELTEKFALAAERAVQAGFDGVEIHAAHGYLLHQFLSPLTNQRTDGYGGSPDHRRRFLEEVVSRVRGVLPEDFPLFVRVSATDWVEGGLTPDDTVQTLKKLAGLGVDFADVSTGGLVPGAKIPLGPGYQVPFAEQVKTQTGLLTGTVGLITDLPQAQAILDSHQADAVLLGRLLLRDPYWVIRHTPGELRTPAPQYLRGF